jgi:hypothetical protein
VEEGRITILPRGFKALTACSWHLCTFQVDQKHKHDGADITLCHSAHGCAGLEFGSDCVTQLKGRLRSRCFGLLEVQEREWGVYDVNTLTINLTSGFTLKMSIDWEIHFLHRSARDFLNQPEIWSEIVAKTESSGFDANVSVLNSYLQQLKAWKPRDRQEGIFSTNPRSSPVWVLVWHAVKFVRRSESSGKSQDKLLDEIDRVVQNHTATAIADALREQPDYEYPISNSQSLRLSDCKDLHWSEFLAETHKRPCARHDSFLSFAVQHDLVLYIQAKLSHKSKLPPKRGCPLLHYAIPMFKFGMQGIMWFQDVKVDMIRLLLSSGADPNLPFNGWSPWQHFLLFLVHITAPTVTHLQKVVMTKKKVHILGEILELLIVHSADPNAECEHSYVLSNGSSQKRRFSALRVICIVFQLNDPNEDKNLHHYFELRGSGEDWMGVDDTFKAIGERLFKLLLDRGGQEKEW